MNIEEIIEVLLNYYGVDEDEAERGCYVNGKWFSIKKIIEILKKGF